MIKNNRTTFGIDWLRVVIPYDFYEVENEYFYSEAGNEQSLGQLSDSLTASNLVFDVIKMLMLNDSLKMPELREGWTLTKGQDFYLYRLSHVDCYIDFNPVDTRILTKYDLNVVDDFKLAINHRDIGLQRLLKAGVSFTLTASGLITLQKKLRRFDKTLDQFLSDITKKFPNAKATRIDLMADFFDSPMYFSPKTISNLGKRGQLKTRCKYGTDIVKTNLQNGEEAGRTYYLGDRSSEKMLRIYDKKHERQYYHGDSWISKVFETWYRWELELKGEVANEVFSKLANSYNLKQCYMEVLVSIVNVTKKDSEEYTRWWLNFVTDENGFEYEPYIKVVEKTNLGIFNRRKRWLRNSVSKSLVKELLIFQMTGGDANAYFNHLISQGSKQFVRKDFEEVYAMIEDMKKIQEVETLKLLCDEDYEVLDEEEIEHREAKILERLIMDNEQMIEGYEQQMIDIYGDGFNDITKFKYGVYFDL